ncbi:MAG: hypothetical protein M1829_005313 [Trizodia sp. TS-e1964]|nr:MAG: hypothetical protein M1829_005313 [Trizodia sp. TS-e1964]
MLEESVAARTPPISNIVRLLMRRVPHAVVVITSLNEKPPNLYCGMTISSFNTLTLSPYPVVSFNIKRPSSTYDAIKFSKEFLVHVLAANAAGAEIAQAFAKQHPAHTSIFPPQFWRLEYDASRKEQRLRDGIMDVLKCHLMPQEIELGDHAVVLGKVSEVQNYGNELRGDVALSYLDGKYRIAEEY